MFLDVTKETKMNVIEKTIDLGDERIITIETGKLAKMNKK